jgi:mono/diheme cytochrome c family protein
MPNCRQCHTRAAEQHMSKLKERAGWLLGGILGLAAMVAAVVLAWSAMILEQTYEFSPRTVVVPSDPESLAQGEKVARTRGCLGCHGKSGEGRLFVDIPWVARVPAPSLTRIVHEWSIEELDRSIRQGLSRDRKSVLAMPSGMYQNLSDADFGALIAYLRSLPQSAHDTGGKFLGLPARWLLLRREIEPERRHFAAYPPAWPDPGDAVAHGRYLAQTTCSECHGPNLHGWPGDAPPGLAIAAAYSPEEFLRLMATGESASGRDLRPDEGSLDRAIRALHGGGSRDHL